MRAIIVGARGGIRELLQRLSEHWDVTVIDRDPERLARLAATRNLTAITGDGSSRIVLERAGLESADAVIAATGDDEVNLEVCRIAHGAGVSHIAAVGADAGRLADYRTAGVNAFVPDMLTARGLERLLEPRRIGSATFAGGKAEALEFRIAEDSPLQGMAVRDLHSESYLVAAVLRDGELIVPHGATLFEPGDLVTVVGATAEFPRIVTTFTSAAPRFPLDFGKNVLAVVTDPNRPEGVVAEAFHLTRNSAAEGLVVLHGAPESSAAIEEAVRRVTPGVEATVVSVPGRVLANVAGAIDEHGVGVVVIEAVPRPSSRRAARLVRLVVRWGRPVLLARGTHPHGRIVVPVRQSPGALAAGRAALDLAAYGKAALTGVAMVSPAFVAGSDDRDRARRALGRLREEGAMLEAPVRRLVRQGNPVRQIAEVAAEADLLVMGMPQRRPTLFTTGTIPHLVARTACSFLLVPAR
jgi:Trk K+ transport system NAD-binding subunit